jgi:predicted nucleic acid-binding protein
MGGNEYLVDTNVALDVVRLVLAARPLYEAVVKGLKDAEAMRQAVASAIGGINRINRRWIASFLFLSYNCRRGVCFVVDFTRRIELPRVFTKLLLGGASPVGRGPLLDEVVGLAERWLSMMGSSLGVGVLGLGYGDFEVAREVVKAYGSCGARSRERVLDNAIDILLVATALNRGYGFVTTDRRLVCGLYNKIVTGVGQVSGGYVPWGSDLVCLADAELGVGGGVLGAKIYLIHEQCNLQCSERERWC